MVCKICNENVKGNIGLARHCSYNHNCKLIDYMIQFENLKTPKCICGKNVNHKDGLVFHSTCGDIRCVKETLKQKRLKYMLDNPEKTAWRLSNMSYPEKLFEDGLVRNNINNNFLIIRERSVFPYFIDFAFENEKVAVEIDGSQHKLESRIIKDHEKNEVLRKNNWRIYRIEAKQVLQNCDLVIKELLDFIGTSKTIGNCGIIIQKSKQIRVSTKLNSERKELNGITYKQKSNFLSQRKIERPSYEELIKDIEVLGYSATGRKYGVSDNSIRKWIKMYNKLGF